MYADNPILGEIRQGFKLRPTKTVDKSKPFFKKAEGEEEPTFNVVKLPPGGAAGTSSSPPAPYAAPPVPKSAPSAPKVPSTAPPPPSGAPPPPPPPMPGLPGAPPPPPPPAFNKTKAPALIKLGGATPADVDLGALLKSIHGGVRLRKTVTNDKSAAILNDDELKSKSIKMVEPTGPPPELMVPTPKPARTPSPATGRSSAAASSSGRSKSPRDRNHLAPDSEDERFHTPDEKIDSRYGTPEPPVDSPPVRRKTPEPPAKVKIDYTFEEKNLKVTSDDLKQEIPSGSAAAKIAKFMQASGNTGGGTVPRAAFRPSPIRSTFQKEVNNNLNVSSDAPKPKPASKWAPVEIGGLKRPSRGNVPFEKTDRAGSERPSVIRERSASALEEPISTDRARTQSPAAERATSTLPAPISVRTDFSDKPTKTTASPKKKPVIQETPPTPKTSTTSYSYNKNTRIASPTESESRTMSSPVSSMSSASLPSPSSISPGSTSPDSTPRRRINPGFDKAKEKFNGGATTPSSGGEGTLPLPRPFFLKNKMGDVHSKSSSPQSSPRGSISNNNEEKEAVKKAVKEAAARQKRVINVPISAPWHSPRDTSDSLRRTHRGIDPYSFVSTHPNDLRRNYRFDIDLSNDSPLSIFNR